MSQAPAAGRPYQPTDYGLQPASPGGAAAVTGRGGVPGSFPEGAAGPAVPFGRLAEIDLAASYQRWLTEIDYLEYAGLISPAEAHRRRREAYSLFDATLADLRTWLELTGC